MTERIDVLEGQKLFEEELSPGRTGSYKAGTYMITYSGKEFYPLSPNPADICIQDIAQALSNCCRFTGHVSQFYSVAQHCVIVSQNCSPENALAGLLHDASEAYLSDIARPVKYTEQMEGYRNIESNLEKVIYEKFGLQYPMPKEVKYWDNMILISEGYKLFRPIPGWVTRRMEENGLTKPLITIESTWPPAVAKAMFMKRFLELNGVVISAPLTDKEAEELD